MDKRKPHTTGARKSRRKTLLIIAAVIAIVIALIVKERIAELYVISTLSVVALLVVVAWSDLGQSRRPATEPAPFDDSAALADGLTSPKASAATAVRSARGRRRA